MAFNTSISGLQAAQKDMGVISNNIANVGTAGFKRSDALFAELYSASLNGTGPQPGSGVTLEAIRNDFGQGGFEFTSSQLDLAIGERLGLGAGLRFDYERKKADLRQTFTTGGIIVQDDRQSFTETYDEILPRFSATYKITDEATLYGLAAKGFQAGGFNLSAPANQFTFDPETSWTYELGLKSSWLDDRVQANAALFFVDWDDMQLSQFDPSAGGFVTNAGESTSQGVELELSAEVTDELTLFGTAGYLETEFDRFTDQFGQDATGNSLLFAPDWTFGAGAQYRRQLGDLYAALLRVDYFHTGEFYYDAGNRGGDRYDLVNLRAGLDCGDVRFDLFLQNALNEVYVPIAFQANPGDPNQFVGQNGAPRTFGLSLRLTF